MGNIYICVQKKRRWCICIGDALGFFVLQVLNSTLTIVKLYIAGTATTTKIFAIHSGSCMQNYLISVVLKNVQHLLLS